MDVKKDKVRINEIPKPLRYKAWQKKKLWKYRLEQLTPNKAKSKEKRSRRFQKYAKLGQLKSGGFFCKSGRPITWERVGQYEAMCHYMVRMFFPSLALWEASFMYEDLVNQCRNEVFLALLNGFDPVKAMTANDPDPIKKADREAIKAANPEKALTAAEKSIVYGRLKSYLRRMTWKFHPDQFGGRTSSLEGIFEGINQEFVNGLYTEPTGQDIDVREQIDQDVVVMFRILRKKGSFCARAFYKWLDEDRQEILREHLFSQATNKWSNIAELFNGDSE